MTKNKAYINDIDRLMEEWDWGENEPEGLNPMKLTVGSGRKAHWICAKGHKWTATIQHRAGQRENCPYCSSKKILAGYNDLKSQHPELMPEWDFEANSIDPSTIAVKSNKVVAWVCPKGHKYTKSIGSRVSGVGCPVCAHARSTSFPEQCFFYYIKKYYPNSINRYRDIFDNGMELDIFIPSLRTGIEYDGAFWHGNTAIKREEKKYKICKEKGIRLFRIKEGTFSEFNEIADRIWYLPTKCSYRQLSIYIFEFMKDLTFSFWPYSLPHIDVAMDKNEILEFKTLKLEDSLLYLNPDLAQEWHPLKNGKLTPDLFVPGSYEKVWWLCPKCGNEWQSTIANRAKGKGCNVCATDKRKTTKRNTLLSNRGSVDKELCLLDWDYETNEHGPDYYTNGSGAIINWKCHKCGYKWKAPICNRTQEYRNGCPLCSGKVIVSGVNDLPSVMPELMQEWDYENNTDINPEKVGRGSHLAVSWKCRKCEYVWRAQIYNRANGKGCPCCANRVVVTGINDLSTTNPDLANEWHPALNTIKPTEVTKGQAIKVYWLCSKCGSVWQDTILHRSRGRGCHTCKKH